MRVNTKFIPPHILKMVPYRVTALALLALRAIGVAASAESVSLLFNASNRLFLKLEKFDVINLE